MIIDVPEKVINLWMAELHAPEMSLANNIQDHKDCPNNITLKRIIVNSYLYSEKK